MKLSFRDIIRTADEATTPTSVWDNQSRVDKSYPQKKELPLDTKEPKKTLFRLDPRRVMREKDISMGLNALNEQHVPAAPPKN